ncbi:hypothetical protein AKJ42_00050 [candidate division MSBL1 archaeon SCGC-AAA261C02]|uniref:Uncharacterized protein n=1 Tax=candidate division MSBL1 archaeon SCGC-AAA261C02 TaxID=1698272 RepID=A0A133V2D8_9EURY|nr:hypothetical protein AKJ42_00050 [candidate division MSBL1 archaeon SCGC-AAA261C02]
MGYMNYEKQPDAIYTPDNTIWIYINVENEKYNLNPDGSFEIWLIADLSLKSPNNTAVPVSGYPSVIRENYPATRDPEEVYLGYYFTLSEGASKGEYTVTLTVTDKLADKTNTISSNFTVE